MYKLENPLDGYQKFNLDNQTKKALEYTDQSTNAKKLLINRDLVDKDRIIDKLSIFELKQCLSICLCDNENNPIKRLCLHANILEFIHPVSKKMICIKSDEPTEMKKVI